MEDIIIKDFININEGNNIDQSCAIGHIEDGLTHTIITSKDLTYIDWLNLSKVTSILVEFFDVNACAIAKENLICSVSLGSSLDTALQKSINNNSTCITESTIGFTKEVTLDLVKQLISMKVKNIISTKYSNDAKEYLKTCSKINAIIIESPLQEALGLMVKEIKSSPFGYITKAPNLNKLTKSNFKVMGSIKPTQQQAEDAIFAWKVSKYTNSKSVVIAKDLSTVAIKQNQISELEAIESSIDYACENSKDATLGYDGAIENERSMNAIVQGRIGLIIDAGTHLNSQKIINIANKYGISIIHTGLHNSTY